MTNPYKNITECTDIRGKRVLLRADMNVPYKNNRVTDDSRLRSMLPTIQFLRDKGAILIILSHFGRPEGQYDENYSLAPVADHLSGLIDSKIKFVSDCIGPEVDSAVQDSTEGDVLVCENLRFYAGETENDQSFAKSLAKNGDIYVNDAFSAAHRAHASTEALAGILPAYAGLLMDQELSSLSKIMTSPAHPVTAVVGGAKVSTKLDVLEHLVKKVDHLILGGGMANTFIYAQGHNVGASLHEPDMVENVQKIIKAAKTADCEIHLPKDMVLATEFREGAPHRNGAVTAIKPDEMALDIGPESVKHIKSVLEKCRTLLWNGPLGAFETPPFDKATCEVAKYAAELTSKGTLFSVGGGGDTVAALEHAGVKGDFSYVSTAGGAFLEFIEGKSLPGVVALTA